MRNVSGLEKETVRKGGEEERVRRLLNGTSRCVVYGCQQKNSAWNLEVGPLDSGLRSWRAPTALPPPA